MKSLIPFCSCGLNYSILYDRIENPDYLYIRRTTADKDFFHFLMFIKEKYPTCKIVVEIYTYPYDKDDYNRSISHRIRMLPYYFRDCHYRVKLKKCVDKFVTYSDDDRIFGVDTIKSCNGVLVDDISCRKVKTNNENKLNLVAVAGMQVHHGYERLINGLGRYYKSNPSRIVVFHLVGEGPEISKYQLLTTQLGISDYVKFYGKRIGKDLDDIYDDADIAIGSLGLYKYHILCNSTLKVGEYLAKGLPIVSGAFISMIEDEKIPFILTLPNDSSDVDINSIVNFHDSLYENASISDVASQIRRFAYERFDMPIVMKPILDYLSD